MTESDKMEVQGKINDSEMIWRKGELVMTILEILNHLAHTTEKRVYFRSIDDKCDDLLYEDGELMFCVRETGEKYIVEFDEMLTMIYFKRLFKY